MAVIPQKPQSFLLNKNDPGVRRIVFDMPLFERGGFSPIDLVSRIHAALTAGSSWNIGQVGPGINLTSSSSKKLAFTAPNYVNNLVRQTVIIIFKSPASYVDAETLYNKGQEGVAANGRYFMAGEYSSGLGAMVIVAAHSLQNGVWTFPTPSASAVHTAIISYDSSSNSNVPLVWVDGVPQTVSTVLGPNGSMIADTTDLTIGNKYSGNNSWSGDIYLTRVLNIVFDLAKARKFTQNPWQPYKNSFVIAKGFSNTTTTRTTTGKARIQELVNQTLTGLARITVSTLRTITGKARVQESVNQTTTGKSRITALVNATATGKARVQQLVNRTATGLARIQESVSQAITGKGRITASVNQTATGKARIQELVNQTLTGLARVTKSVLQTLAGKARITAATSRTLTGVAKIASMFTGTDQAITGKARIIKGPWWTPITTAFYSRENIDWYTRMQSNWYTKY
jgi:hypothetical protein